ncbi:tetraacyldisaccharide 4'-kinase [Gaetbulibacter sp. M240]|uniref:tetraacyldisaccharide 4'-kinase n=1 Tax=Gaetbulibacter sp. M240 TaxID=3126511 RepID=UPI00374FD2BD
MKLLRYLLFPFVPIYYVVTWLRNKLFDIGVLSQKKYDFPVICVGNLSVGGTGKTPMIEYLIRLLMDDYKVATLSRGYKRKTKGFQLADSSSTAQSLGDEPFQFFNKFKNAVQVAVDTKRSHGIGQLLKTDQKPDVILLDDAYQHRKVKAGFNILLTTYANPYFNDMVLPTGDLREPKIGAKRADIIVVTKCPDALSPVESEQIIQKIEPQSHQKVFFSSIVYDENVYSNEESIKLDNLPRFTLVTGIADASALVAYLNGKGLQFEHLEFGDHHEFNDDDIKVLSGKELILTTEKDFMRLKDFEVLKNSLYYLPMKISLKEGEVFDSLIKSFLVD